MARPRKYFTEEEKRAAKNRDSNKHYHSLAQRNPIQAGFSNGVYYSYIWLRADSTPYYVGKGCANRAFVNAGHGVHRPVSRARILVQVWDSEEKALEVEKWYISFYGRKDNGTGILRNLTDGGETPPVKVKGKYNLSESVKLRISKKIKLLWTDPAYRAHMSEAHKGERYVDELLPQ